MTNRRWRRIQRRARAAEDRRLWGLLARAFEEIRLEEAIERDIEEFQRAWDAGEIPPLTEEQQAAMEKARVKFMAGLRYYHAEGVWPR